jgi:hypothetical protein
MYFTLKVKCMLWGTLKRQEVGTRMSKKKRRKMIGYENCKAGKSFIYIVGKCMNQFILSCMFHPLTIPKTRH